MKPIPITAYGAINALGDTTQAVVDGLFAGRTGLEPAPEWVGLETHCGVVSAALGALPEGWGRFESRQARLCLRTYSLVAEQAQRAVAKWGPARVGMVLGTSTAGIAESEAAFSHRKAEGELPEAFSFENQHALDAGLELLRAVSGVEGPAYLVSTACSSSAKVFGSAARIMQLGLADAMIVGGVDTLCGMTLHGFRSLGVLSKASCKPFSGERAGINIGEAGAMLVLEREADASLFLGGVGESEDAHHMTAPHPDGLGAKAAMRAAMLDAGIGPADISHVNAHATGTKQNDAAEARAIGELFGGETPVIGTKGYTGHTLGAAGATEAVFALASLQRRVIPGSLGCEPVDPDVAVSVVAEARPSDARFALSNSLAFGGSNVSVVFGRKEDA